MESDIRETISFYYSSYIKDAVAPSRVRGLKPFNPLNTKCAGSRTLTGAWIEAGMGHTPRAMAPSRTLTGAWIEAVFL